MEGLSLGGCISKRQYFITFAWKVLGWLQVYSVLPGLVVPCPLAALGMATLAIPSPSSSELEDSTGRMGDERKCNIPCRICSESCLGEQLPQFASAPWPRMCSLPFALSFPMGWLGCSVRPCAFSLLKLICPIWSCLSPPWFPCNPGVFFCFLVPFYFPHLIPAPPISLLPQIWALISRTQLFSLLLLDPIK